MEAYSSLKYRKVTVSLDFIEGLPNVSTEASWGKFGSAWMKNQFNRISNVSLDGSANQYHISLHHTTLKDGYQHDINNPHFPRFHEGITALWLQPWGGTIYLWDDTMNANNEWKRITVRISQHSQSTCPRWGVGSGLGTTGLCSCSCLW